MKKLFGLLCFSIISLMGMASSEELAPELFQEIGHEAQDNFEIPKVKQTDIFVDSTLDASSGTVMFYFPKTKRIYVTSYCLGELQKVGIGVLRFLLHHEAAHKLHDIWHARSHLKALEERSADCKAVAACGCYKCVNEYLTALYDHCYKIFFEKNGKLPSQKELGRIFAMHERDGYLSYDDLADRAAELQREEKLCKYHCSILIDKGKIWFYKITGLFTEPLFVLILNKNDSTDTFFDHFFQIRKV